MSSTIFRQVARAACLLFFCGLAGGVWAQPKRFRPQPQYVQIGQPDQAEGRRILEDFRTRGIEGDYYWDFSLRVKPWRADDYFIPGRMWGGRNERGAITRIVLWPGVAENERRLLVQDGRDGATWSWDAAAGISKMDTAAWFEPLAGTQLTVFDLQMPFKYWDDFAFEGVVNRNDRPAYVFLLYPPAEIAAQKPELAGVRIYLDTAYRAILQFELIGEGNRVLKTFKLLVLKKIDEQWIVKSAEVRDEETRNKTEFIVNEAAMAQDFPDTFFDPASLEESLRPPTGKGVRKIEP